MKVRVSKETSSCSAKCNYKILSKIKCNLFPSLLSFLQHPKSSVSNSFSVHTPLSNWQPLSWLLFTCMLNCFLIFTFIAIDIHSDYIWSEPILLECVMERHVQRLLSMQWVKTKCLSWDSYINLTTLPQPVRDQAMWPGLVKREWKCWSV